MTTDSVPADVDRSALGRAAAQRLRRPGRPGLIRSVGLGLVAESSSRFAAGTARPTVVRRALAASATVAARSIGQAEIRPPRWWTPRLPDEGMAAADSAPAPGRRSPAAVSLPPRGLARAARQVPTDNQPRSPGTIAGSLVSTAIPVRRMEEVVAAGPMTSSHEQRRLHAPRRAPAPSVAGPPSSAVSSSSSSAGPPGQSTGGGAPTPARAASAGAVPPAQRHCRRAPAFGGPGECRPAGSGSGARGRRSAGRPAAVCGASRPGRLRPCRLSFVGCWVGFWFAGFWFAGSRSVGSRSGDRATPDHGGTAARRT